MKNYTYNATENLLPSRLDKLLTELSGFSRSRIQKLIKGNKVKIDSVFEVDSSKEISKECVIEILDIIEENKADIKPKEIDFEIVYEDEDLVIINKPAGLTVHPGAGNHDDTLVNGLIYKFSNNLSSINYEDRPGIVHRIDRDTTGLLVVAKNNEGHVILSKQIERKTAKRSYIALAWGFPKENGGTIKTNIGRSNKDRTKMTVLQHGGKVAITHYRTLEILANGLFSLIECELETGRTHQIRVHLSHLGHSIIGDQTYGANSRKIKQILDRNLREILSMMNRQALHAYKLEFVHPRTHELMKFEIELPDDIKSLLSRVKSLNV